MKDLSELSLGTGRLTSCLLVYAIVKSLHGYLDPFLLIIRAVLVACRTLSTSKTRKIAQVEDGPGAYFSGNTSDGGELHLLIVRYFANADFSG